MDFNNVSKLWIVVMILQSVGFLFTLIGFGGNYIVVVTNADTHGGLWEVCFADNCLDTGCWLFGAKRSRVWLSASKGMMTISVICQFLTILLTATALFRTVTKLVGWITAAVAAFSVLNGLIGVAVVAGEGTNFLDDHIKNAVIEVGWSFILFMIGQCVYLLAAAWHYVDSRNKSLRHSPETAAK